MVLGADACRAAGSVSSSTSRPGRGVCVAPTFAELVAIASIRVDLQMVAVDMPIGLPDTTRRQACAIVRAGVAGVPVSGASTAGQPFEPLNEDRPARLAT